MKKIVPVILSAFVLAACKPAEVVTPANAQAPVEVQRSSHDPKVSQTECYHAVYLQTLKHHITEHMARSTNGVDVVIEKTGGNPTPDGLECQSIVVINTSTQEFVTMIDWRVTGGEHLSGSRVAIDNIDHRIMAQKINIDTFNQLHAGMPISQVFAIMGLPDKGGHVSKVDPRVDPSMKVFWWNFEDGAKVTIITQHDVIYQLQNNGLTKEVQYKKQDLELLKELLG